MASKSHNEIVDVSEFDPRSIPMSSTWVVVGAPGSGKSTFMENMMYYNKDRYPSGRASVGTETGYQRMCEVMHPLFVSNDYNEEDHTRLANRQNLCIRENGLDYFGNFSVNMMDDVGSPTMFKLEIMRNMFKRGSQHWKQLNMIGTQYAIDFPPDIRKSVTYVALFNEPDDNERKKLYANFGGTAGTYQDFCNLMDTVCEPYTCLIIKKQRPSKNKSENFFWFKTRQLSMWKFGCDEWRKWGEERYNKNHVDAIF